MSASPVPGPPHERLIVYIDGFNFYHGMHDKFGRSTLWIDFVALAQSLRPRSHIVAVKYFTAPVLGDAGAASRQAYHQAAVAARHTNVFSVTQGRYQAKTVTCFNCRATRTVHEEKETDVNIAVALVGDAAANAMDSALIISADSDLAPAVRAAKQFRPHMFIGAAFPPKRFSSELKQLMPASSQIGRDKIRQALLPASFTVGATTYTRPPKWR